MLDASGQALAYVYARETPEQASIAKVLTFDEARRIAANVAKLPELLEMATMHPNTYFSHAIMSLGLFFVEASPSLAFDRAKLDTFFTTNSCKYCDLSEADLSGRNMRGADLENAQMSKAKLSGSDLSALPMEKRTKRANLQSANLRNADLTNANLANAAAAGAYFREANLTSADLSGADLSSANLQDANLTNATLDGAKLDNAKFCRTLMPDGSKNNSGC